MSFPPHFLETLRTRVSLADIVGKRVTFDRRKSNPRRRDYWACCPFHGEKSPSFHVDDAKGFYHCFGCGVSGDAISFVQQVENLSFSEAVEQLAHSAGLQVPARDPADARREQARRSLGEVLDLAQRHFVRGFLGRTGDGARAYLERRGCREPDWRSFEIGYAPNGRTVLYDALKSEGIDDDLLVQAGLVSMAEGRAPLDRFRDRVMFPIRDPRERLVGFGGRILSEGSDAPKYLNSPETALFDKGRLLFNHAKARKALREAGTLVVVEGYMDVIALHSAGVEHAVAPLGTALTEEQLALLWRETGEPVLCFDGDGAGQRAAYRALDLALPHVRAGQSLRFVILPEGKDPDDLVRSGGADAVAAVLSQPVPLIDMLWEREIASAPHDTPERKADLERRLQAGARRITDTGVRAHYETELRGRLRELFAPPMRSAGATYPRGGPYRPGRGRPGRPVPIEGVSSLLKRNPLARAALALDSAPAGPVAGMALLEDLEGVLLTILVECPQIVERVAETLAEMRLASPKLDKIARELIHLVTDRGLDSTALQDHLKSCGITTAIADIATRPIVRRMRGGFAAYSAAEGEQVWRCFASRHDRAVKLWAEIEEAHAAAIGDNADAERHLLRLEALLAERQSLEVEQFGPADGPSLSPGG